MLLAIREKERILIALTRMSTHCLRVNLLLRHHVDRDLLTEQALLCIELVLFIFHWVISSKISKSLSMNICLLQIMLFTDLMKGKLVLDRLTYHVSKFMNITEVDPSTHRLRRSPILSIHDDWHDQRLLLGLGHLGTLYISILGLLRLLSQ